MDSFTHTVPIVSLLYSHALYLLEGFANEKDQATGIGSRLVLYRPIQLYWPYITFYFCAECVAK